MQSEEPMAWSTKQHCCLYKRGRMSCGVPRHWRSAERKGDRDQCEAPQHQVVAKGPELGHLGQELS